MKHTGRLFLFIAMALAASTTFAAKPTSIKFIEDITAANGQTYSFYTVKCSNGEEKEMSAWDKRKRWCPGKGLEENCKKKQIKVAKKVCKG